MAEKLRYAPHGAARSLITRRTHTLGVLLPDLFGEFFSELIRGIDLAARRRGYHVIVSGSHSDRAETRAMVRAMRGRVDGLIVLSADLDARELEANLPVGFPVVLLNGAGKGVFDAIRVDNSGGASAMVRHLIGLGHRRIAFVTGPAGISTRPRDCAGSGTPWVRRPGRLLSRSPATSARRPVIARRLASFARSCARPLVLAANDAMAIGLLSAFRERHVRVPEDIALAGFDDIPIARFMTPSLTSVRVPIAELGARSTERLLQTLEGGNGNSGREETLPTTLVVRSSCGAQRQKRTVAASRRPRPAAPGPRPLDLDDDSEEVRDRRFATLSKEDT